MADSNVLQPRTPMVRVDPPQSVKQSLADLDAACRTWPPQATSYPLEGLGVEARICDELVGGHDPGQIGFHAGLALGLLAGMVLVWAGHHLMGWVRQVFRGQRSTMQADRGGPS